MPRFPLLLVTALLACVESESPSAQGDQGTSTNESPARSVFLPDAQGDLVSLDESTLAYGVEYDDGVFEVDVSAEDLRDTESLGEVPVNEAYEDAHSTARCAYRCYPIGEGTYICFVVGSGTGCPDVFYIVE